MIPLQSLTSAVQILSHFEASFAKVHQRMITPMVARLVLEPFDRDGWFFELKWDGFRAIAERDHAGHVSLYSRNH